MSEMRHSGTLSIKVLKFRFRTHRSLLIARHF
jgi:hypothetical protein